MGEKKLDRPATNDTLHLKLQPFKRSGDLVIKTASLSVGYADEGRPLFIVPNLILLRGECAAVIGQNGAGKTTLLKTLLGQIPPLNGEAILGAGIKIGYFAQAHEGLNPNNTLMEEINKAALKCCREMFATIWQNFCSPVMMPLNRFRCSPVVNAAGWHWPALL